MTKRERDESVIPGIPELAVSPPLEPPLVLPGPQDFPPAESSDAPKKKRKRKQKAAEPEPVIPEGQVSEQDLENCRQALTTTFAIASKVAAKHRGEHWLLEDEEAESLGQVWTSALAPYLPKIGAAVPWATALIVTATMVMPRVERDRELRSPPVDPNAMPPRPEVMR